MCFYVAWLKGCDQCIFTVEEVVSSYSIFMAVDQLKILRGVPLDRRRRGARIAEDWSATTEWKGALG